MSRKVSASLDLLFGSESDRRSESDEGGAAPKCSNQTDLGLTLADLFYRSDLPERPSPTSVRLVCIQKARGSSPLSSTGQRPVAILKAPKQSQTKSQSRCTITVHYPAYDGDCAPWA